MKTMFLAATLLLGATAVPAAAQPPLDPAALDLARVLMQRDESLYDDADSSRIQSRIENLLLAEPGACNAFVPACRAAATGAAQLHAPSFRQAERARREQVTAYLLADRLQPAEMARFATYLRGEEGGRLLAALASLRQDDAQVQRRRREIERMLERSTPGALAEARAEFRRRSRNLPAAPPR
ncbi:MAG TPA: hypothetical protein VMG08_16730 [Allosphingosinicella sp.]|nr:hypothetical protein [Allosphingosinicella sp.]